MRCTSSFAFCLVLTITRERTPLSFCFECVTDEVLEQYSRTVVIIYGTIEVRLVLKFVVRLPSQPELRRPLTVSWSSRESFSFFLRSVSPNHFSIYTRSKRERLPKCFLVFLHQQDFPAFSCHVKYEVRNTTY